MKKLLFILSLPLFLLVGIEVYNYFAVRHFDYDKKIEKVELDLEIVELNKQLNSENIAQVFEAHPTLAKHYFGLEGQYRTEVVETFAKMYSNEEFQELCRDVNAEFSNLDAFKKELTYAFKTLKFYFPEIKIPKVYTLVSGFGTNLFVGEDIVIVALEYFLSDKTRWKSKMPSYIAKTYTPESIATKIILTIVNRLARFDNSDKTLLNHMLLFGRIAYFTRVALPKVAEEIILEYTKENFDYLMKFESVIWNFFLANEYLYSDDYLAIKSYTGKSPFTQEISMECPGNVGGFIGYRIIKSFMDHNDYDVLDLLLNSDTQYFFTKSKYNPNRT